MCIRDRLCMDSGLIENCRVDAPDGDRAAGAAQVLRAGGVAVTGMGAV